MLSSHPVNSAVGHVHGHHSDTFSIVSHDKVKSEVLNKKDAIVSECSSKERVEHRMSSSVSNGTASVSLTSGSEFERLATESALIDLPFFSPAEGHAV